MLALGGRRSDDDETVIPAPSPFPSLNLLILLGGSF